ncbi:neutral zinc metallopeptidase [Brevundimonas sp.]|uniref:KPN_02809 family neutral zinc metallopeptidase n=1 Tax=Brevundimonas sp. TaxID=1871086 RepID=UPI002AB824DD|nr:neutral zinc metallopeptidase [Brevundimonas sp.]MDZ4362999.1 neutral zinc metallopeptidase [Brevundimonas sp.]
MKWQGGRQGGGGISDRRGMGGGALAGGGLGVGVLAILGYVFFGIDPATTTQLASQFGGVGSTEAGVEGTPQDQAGQFVDVIGGNVNDVWTAQLMGYQPPTVVLYESGTNTGCGFGQAAMGPFYCPSDRTVYLDLGFWQQMQTQLGASGADFAKAYVIAHEFGHHVQTLMGTSDQVRSAQQRASSEAEGNRYSVALELQADCYAGVWARNAATVSNGQVALEPGDLEEGLRTASAIGDDAIQSRGGGRVSPDSFTHGSSEQRVEWLRRGYQSGDPATCDTFAGL